MVKQNFRELAQSVLDLSINLPKDFERFSARERRYKEVVVFVHHYGGDNSTTKRHVKFVNELGFDAVTFTLSHNHIKNMRRLPLTKDYKIGLRHFWAEEIRQVLNKIDEPKILYSFSYPSASALLALAEPLRRDVVTWVCDGGPFFQLKKCFRNYYRHITGFKNPVLIAGVTEATWWLWGLNYENEISQALNALPHDYPVLSVRSWKDKLVPASAIDEVFNSHSHLHYQTLVIHDADHIQGLKDYPDTYRPNVAEFLKLHATSIGAV